MNTLIIYAHPDHESHAKTTLEYVKEKLESKKEDYEVLDLYKMHFNPILSEKEIYHKDHESIKDVILLQEKITNAKHLIVIYPIWWNGMPAILKGFIDRVFSSGYAFKYEKGIPKGLLPNKKATVFVTTGANKLMTCIFLGNRFKKNAQRDIFGFCGIKTKVYHVDKAYNLNHTQKSRIKKNVEKALK